jgi:TIR domain
MTDPRNFDVFISYSSKDRNWASKFANELEANGVHAWFDQTEIAIGDRVTEKLEEALRESKIIAVVVTPDYLTNPSSAFELGAAVGGNKKIIPIVPREVGPMSMPSLLRGRQLLQESSPQAAGKAVAAVVGNFTPSLSGKFSG